MKKFIILTMLLCASVFTFGQEPSGLHVQKMDGTTQIALLVTIEKITFEEDVLVMTTTEGEFRLPLDDVEKVVYRKRARGILLFEIVITVISLLLNDKRIAICMMMVFGVMVIMLLLGQWKNRYLRKLHNF